MLYPLIESNSPKSRRLPVYCREAAGKKVRHVFLEGSYLPELPVVLSQDSPAERGAEDQV